MGREKAVRIGIAESGTPLSAVWRIWLNGADVYIASRVLARSFKTSLHASGRFRHAFVSDAVSERFRPVGADRAVSKWDRPAPQALGGTLLFQLLFPASELRSARHGEPVASDVVWLPRTPPGTVTYISVLELSPDAAGQTPRFREITTTTPIASWPTDTGSTVWVTAYVAPITPEQEREIARLRVALIEKTATMELNDLPGEPRSHLRSFGLFEPPDGIGRIADIDAEFLRDRRRRIAERAYFLWENRTGDRWWDVLSNWLQAEQIESASPA